MNKLCASILLSITALGFTSQVFAAAKEYDFEIIIFEDTSGKYRDAEQWPDWSPDNQPGNTQFDTASPSTSIRDIPTGLSGQQGYPETNAVINITPIGSIGLDKYAEKLRRSNRYNVLVHKSWRQTGLSDNTSVSIPIDSRVDNISASAAVIQQMQMGSSATQQERKTRIYGDIKLVLGRYLHLYTDLVYQQPRTQPQPVWQTLNTSPYTNYPIKYHRKMRSKELHYIDHPLVGILIMALPVKKTGEGVGSGSTE
jgi:hypothetical protein